APNTLWVKNLRTSVPFLFFISLVVSVGMWLERYVIIVTSLHRDFVPSSWGIYRGTFYDWAAFIGTMGLFVTLLFLFVRLLPAISICEMRARGRGGGVEEQRGGAAPRARRRSTACWPSSTAPARWWRRRPRSTRPATARWTPTPPTPSKRFPR